MRTNMSGQSYVTPAMALLILVLIAPSLYGFYFSLFDIKYLKATTFVGFENYTYLATDPEFIDVIVRSFVFTTLAVALTVSVALAVALWINQLSGWFALLIQIVVIMPWVVSHVVGALLFRWVFVTDLGLATYLLDQLGYPNFQPLGDRYLAMMALILYTLWRSLGFAVLLLLSGIKSIPTDLYEAAHVDGASAWQRFVKITLPMLKTPMLITLVILTVSNLNNVEAPLIVTGGGPADSTNILPLYLYMTAFSKFDFNSAIALGIGMFAANIVLALAYVKLVKRNG